MAKASDTTPGKEPLLGLVEAEWTHYATCNTYDGYGAENVDLEQDHNHPTYMSLEQAKDNAISEGHAGFVFAPETGQVWRLKTVIDPSSFKYAYWAEVYVLGQRSVAADTKGWRCGCRRKRPACQDDAVDASGRKKARARTWTHYPGRNAYDGNGAENVDLERDNNSPIYKTVEKAKEDVISKGYAGFTYDPANGRMWRLKTIIDPNRFKRSRWVDVYVLKDRGGNAG
mmetsp:Transcript_56146/g.87427  ORF Transcript_56146/g.87427 Transcript_56146/m.87427 type:complete len:228 (+) Transcript_56146:72-755(+)